MKAVGSDQEADVAVAVHDDSLRPGITSGVQHLTNKSKLDSVMTEDCMHQLSPRSLSRPPFDRPMVGWTTRPFRVRCIVRDETLILNFLEGLGWCNEWPSHFMKALLAVRAFCTYHRSSVRSFRACSMVHILEGLLAC